MPIDENAGLGNEPAGDDNPLDTIINQAIEAQDTEPATEGETKSDGRSRDERGRFAPKEPAAAASREPTNAANTEAQQQPVDPASQPVEPPARWTADEKAKFASWPRDVQLAVTERYRAIEADYTRKTQEAAEIRKNAEPWLSAVEPFKEYLAQVAPSLGLHPQDLVGRVLQAEYILRTGDPQQKFTAFQQLAHEYGVNLAALAGGQYVEPDPTITNLRQELATLQQWRNQFEYQTQQQQTEQAVSQIDAFAAAKDEAGRPRYPHFERVRGVMGQLMAQGEANNLEDAYQKATAPIQEAIAEELRFRQSNADAQRKEAVAKADKAAPVRSSGSQPNGAARGKDLDSILNDAISRAGM
jgi:hypothetical protein